MSHDPSDDGRERLSKALAVLLGEAPAVECSSDNQRHRHRKPRVAPPDGLRTADEAAAKLGCSIKTLKAHVDAGELKYVVIGRGTKRPRRYFTDSDLAAFIAAQTREASPCPYDATHAPRSGSTISKSTVIAFSARPRKPTGAKPKR